MNTRMLVMGSLSALVLGGTMVGCTAGGGTRVASASDVDAAAKARTANRDAARAGKALARQDTATAIALAEGAVALSPRDGGYRALLGQAYLRAGRFTSARTALGEALTLQPQNGKAALNLVLAQIATGDWAVARQTLATHADIIPATDRGLALALAGDPVTGAALLTQVVRSPEASVKARQNLALVLALAGNWNMARMIAAADMKPAEVDARMEQWAAFAQPRHASDQVASLLGITPALDGGQPIALALNAPVQVARAEPVAVAMSPTPTPTPVAAAPVSAATPVSVAPNKPAVVFAARQEVVQPLPATTLRPSASPARVALASSPVPLAKGGGWVVQIGAFDSAGVAKDAWSRATRRLPALANHGPSGMTFHARNGRFYRLSVGGLARGDADTLCRRYRARGGVCFVRSNAGDQIAQWLKGGVQLAARS